MNIIFIFWCWFWYVFWSIFFRLFWSTIYRISFTIPSQHSTEKFAIVIQFTCFWIGEVKFKRPTADEAQKSSMTITTSSWTEATKKFRISFSNNRKPIWITVMMLWTRKNEVTVFKWEICIYNLFLLFGPNSGNWHRQIWIQLKLVFQKDYWQILVIEILILMLILCGSLRACLT